MEENTFGQCPLPITNHDTVQMAHGGGGQMMSDLVRKLFVWAFDNPELQQLRDASVLPVEGNRFAFSTDSFVVDPIFFPGGNIGELAIYGTVNDIAMSGARPLYMSISFILEEGLPLNDLREVVLSAKSAADRAGVSITCGDTKVVDRGKADKMFITTSGIGLFDHDITLGHERIQVGDSVLISGTIADHGIAVMSKREGLSFETSVESDTAPLNDLVARLLEAGEAKVHALRDPTRGGIASTLNEFAESARVGIEVWEDSIELRPPVAAACELLGLDPLYVANEGKLVAFIESSASNSILKALHEHELGKDARVIGTVVDRHPGIVTLKTRIGGRRIVDTLVGEQLPRIC